jgi:hypothetical protein
MKYKKKPVVIDAKRFQPIPQDLIFIFESGVTFPVYLVKDNPVLLIETLEGIHQANAGDWIIRGVKGEFYPCKPDIFTLTYEPA